jgi:hypothetical protein
LSYYPYPYQYWQRPNFYQPYPILPLYDPRSMYQAMTPNYQTQFLQYPHQFYQQQGMRGPGLGTDVAGVLDFGALRWWALRGLMGY